MKRLLLYLMMLVLVVIVVDVGAKGKEVKEIAKVVKKDLKTDEKTIKDFEKSLEKLKKDKEKIPRINVNATGIVIDIEDEEEETGVLGLQEVGYKSELSPYSGVVQLEFIVTDSSGSDHVGVCTGYLIDYDSVLTAGHCLYSFEHGGAWATGIKITPGYNTNNGQSEPYGFTYSSGIAVADDWFDDEDYRHDWGVIELTNPMYHPYVFPLSNYQYESQLIHTAGYPAEFSNRYGTVMYEDIGVVSNEHIYQLESSSLYVEGGQSGSPVWNSNNDCIGIVSGINDATGDTVVVKIRNALINYLKANDHLEETYNAVTYHEVTFEDWDGTVLKIEEVSEYEDVTPPLNEPVRTGYTFDGWSDSYTEIVADKTINAEYSIKTYTVTFKDWDGSILSTQTVDYNSDAIPPSQPTRTNYTFIGWNNVYVNIAVDKTITAQYAQDSPPPPACPEHFTVTFEDWDGTTLKSESICNGYYATPPTEPTRIGYTFVGWNGDYTDVWQDKTVVAEYVVAEYYTVIFQDDDGTVLKTESVQEFYDATPPTEPTKDGWNFEGWDYPYTNVQKDTVTQAYYSPDGGTVWP